MAYAEYIIAKNETRTIRDLNGQQMLATIEESTTASKAYAVGDYLILNDKVYKVTVAIASGGTITVGTNITETKVGAELTNLNRQISDLENTTTDIQDSFYKYESSVFETPTTGTSTANNKRILLNVGNPIKSNVFIGNVVMMGDSNLTGTAKVELATLNNGTYTVYDSFTENIESKEGEVSNILSVGKTTIGETYVFVTLSTNHMFYAANVTGKTMVVADNISSNSFRTRNVNNYEVEYRIYCSVSIELVSLVENLLTKQIIYEQEEPADTNSPTNYWWCYQSIVLSAAISYRIELSGNASGNTMYLAVVSNSTKEVKQILSVVDNAVKKYRFDVMPDEDSILLIKSVPYGNYGGTYATVTRTNASLTVGDIVSFDAWSSTVLAFGLNVYLISGEVVHTEEKIDELNKRIVIVSKDGTGQYNTVVDAVENEPENTVIVVKPGIYEGTIQAFNKRIILIGTDRNKCILKSTDGRYAYPVVNCSCGYFENITFISEYLSGTSNEIDDLTMGAYAVHCESEYAVNNILELHHCTLKSDFFPAMGIGLRKDFKVIIDDCDFTNNQIIGRGKYSNTSDGTLGALYLHDSNGEQGNQYIELKNSILRSSLGTSMTIYQVDRAPQNNHVYCEFIQNVLHDERNNYTNNIWYRGDPFNQQTGVFEITIGYGNSNSGLNN